LPDIWKAKFAPKASVVLGGVPPLPWRAEATEVELNDKTLTAEVIKKAAEVAVDKALPMKQNAYKIQLTKVMVKRALEKLI